LETAEPIEAISRNFPLFFAEPYANTLPVYTTDNIITRLHYV